MAGERDPQKGATFVEHHKSSSSSSDSSSGSTSSTSPPTTPPSPEEQQNGPPALPRIHHAPHSSTPPRRARGRGRGYAQPSARLGAIDEHSNTMAPDIPTRNPSRLKQVRFFGLPLPSWAKPDADVPPPDAYDTITGPRGEKFADVRQNKPKDLIAQGKRRRKMICFGLVAIILLVIAITLGVGLGVGLTRRKANSVNVSPPTSSSAPATDSSSPFPLGPWSIQTYLTTTVTTCTSNPATWRCYPYTTYSTSPSTSPSSSFSTLLWLITSPTNSTLDLLISNTNPTFSYPFTNEPLTLLDANNASLSAFAFEFTYRKQVSPASDITGDNAATRCYYDDTLVSVRLYGDKQDAGGDVLGAPVGMDADAGTTRAWPYAVEYEETASRGPECFRVVDGVEGERVDVESGDGKCGCGYRNFGLG